ncbi:GntR family transcriptional regulator [Halobacillus andaensis]|uniref:GntR family transcriptional regulator n=1 Tax=Halobacillus andaensis TaxID=1176239 RepID=A0A917B6G5_HALAA|nr:GntR family transcriptional regulator [Halobacillus andaensis]MBP2006106.1 GntR family transcriptional regulator [Halobacillus andaensis]GGF23606.1 GntR family transcriptional regulator [Halobacillus andaensis]
MSSHQRKMPLYVQIKNKMIHNVNEEIWPPGESIPSESQLMAQYNVSRTTIRQAVRDLVQAGILETRRGAPTKVRQQPQENMENPGVIHHELGEEMAVKILRAENRLPHYFAKSQLHISEDEEVYVLERLRLADQKPIAFQQLFMPKDIGEKVHDKAEVDFDLFPHLGRYNIHYSTIKENVSASNATRYEADLLGITPGEALIDIERITLGMDQQPIEYSRTKYLPASFHYRIEIGS